MTTYKARVEGFWKWYASVADDFYAVIEDGRCPELEPKLNDALQRFKLDFAWEFGPGRKKGEHSLALTPEGNLDKQFLTDYWVSRAPALKGWTFYSSRQADKVVGCGINVHGLSFDLDQLLVMANPNTECKKFDLTVWHPQFPKADDDARWVVATVALDDALGEHEAQMWISDLKIRKVTDGMSMAELPAHIKRIATKNGWKHLPPGEEYHAYQMPSPSQDFLRADTISGGTSHMSLVAAYLEGKGKMKDPLAGSGANYVFVSFDSHALPKGREVAFRAAMEDAIHERLSTAQTGRLIGGAYGFASAYMDFILFDGETSIDELKRAARNAKVPSGASIHSFSEDRKWPI